MAVSAAIGLSAGLASPAIMTAVAAVAALALAVAGVALKRVRAADRRLAASAAQVAELTARNRELLATRVERGREQVDHDHFFDLSLDLLVVASFDGRFLQLNPAWERELGFSIDELKARPFLEMVHPVDRALTESELQRLRMGGRSVGFENRYLGRDGAYRWLSWCAVALPESQRIYAVARDISERKKLDQIKNDFISVVSHELRTPLTSIRG
ncbi:MAG TPA: PAS domain S-box protein, partial [Thermoanaerobaculia bacterium]|nr:PAS domain S-box protein [Thermoanaerobaculia bacterium]